MTKDVFDGKVFDRPVSSCMFFESWRTKGAPGDFCLGQVTAPTEADALREDKDETEDPERVSRPLREKNKKNGAHKHVPHREKPPQVVARRNARERRRVQAVNSAFLRLRKAVPIENTRGKRVSKVKTLQTAIQYIQGLQQLLQQDGRYTANEPCTFQHVIKEDFFEDLLLEEEF